MRATKAYIAGLGTTGILITCSVLLLTVGSALIAFEGWPGVASGDGLERVVKNQAERSAGQSRHRAMAERGQAATGAARLGAFPTGRPAGQRPARRALAQGRPRSRRRRLQLGTAQFRRRRHSHQRGRREQADAGTRPGSGRRQQSRAGHRRARRHRREHDRRAGRHRPGNDWRARRRGGRRLARPRRDRVRHWQRRRAGRGRRRSGGRPSGRGHRPDRERPAALGPSGGPDEAAAHALQLEVVLQRAVVPARQEQQALRLARPFVEILAHRVGDCSSPRACMRSSAVPGPRRATAS